MMGCFGSKEDAPVDTTKQNAKKSEVKEYSWDKQRKELNPEDFIVRKANGQVIIKEPGSVNGQQFIIEDCENCDIYVCDFSASVTIDNCTNCRIFVGPVESSIFVRNCKGCKCIIACQQWRTRDCEDMDVYLYACTQPIIESSTRMRFACFQFFYPALADQFAAAKMNPLVNNWSSMYDFTPGEDHWSYLPKDIPYNNFFKPLPTSILPADMSLSPSVVPLTWGNRPKPSPESCLVVIFKTHKDKVPDFCASVSSAEGNFTITQVAEKVISPEILGNEASAHLKDPSIAIEVNGSDVVSYMQKFVTGFASRHGVNAAEMAYVSPTTAAANEQLGKIFEQVNIEI